MNVKDYIEQHDSINYCEAIVYPNGDIEDCVPGHVYKFMDVTGKSNEEIDKLMPITASPIHWLIGYTKCVGLWTRFFIYDTITDEQIDTIQQLVIHNVLPEKGICGDKTDEYSRCSMIDMCEKGQMSYEDLPERPTEKIHIFKNQVIHL